MVWIKELLVKKKKKKKLLILGIIILSVFSLACVYTIAKASGQLPSGGAISRLVKPLAACYQHPGRRRVTREGMLEEVKERT